MLIDIVPVFCYNLSHFLTNWFVSFTVNLCVGIKKHLAATSNCQWFRNDLHSLYFILKCVLECPNVDIEKDL